MRIVGLPRWGIMVGAGIAAGTVATAVQVLLWLALSAGFPGVLFRDARLTAALVLGRQVLPPPATFDTAVWVAATLIHFTLSIAYAALIGPLAQRLAGARLLVSGAVLGIALYVVNLYGFAALFPWFAQARGWIAAAAHVAFGVTAVAAYRFLLFRYGVSPPGAR